MEYMYITNRVKVAKIAQDAGVEKIWVDIEKNGKHERQKGMNSVKSNHKLSDIKKLRPIIKKSEILVRINPVYKETKNEINTAIDYGADIIMLPMFKNVKDVEIFLDYVSFRVKTMLLVETKEAAENLEDIINLNGINELHIGLNDLHLSLQKEFMFELLVDGTVEKIMNIAKKKNMPCGIGGVGRIGEGLIPAEIIFLENFRLGSSGMILSRTFAQLGYGQNLDEFKYKFESNLEKLRELEKVASKMTEKEFHENTVCLKNKIGNILFERKNV